MMKNNTIATGLGLLGVISAVAANPLKIGDKAPDFTLKNEAGTEFTLSTQLKESKVALLFYRSGNWWPPCKKQLVELQSGVENIKKEKAVLWAINFDTPETLKTVKSDLNITFPLLSDAGSKIIDTYGVRNKEKDGTDQEGLAKPTIFILDKEGKITATFAYESVGKRHGSEDIIKALK